MNRHCYYCGSAKEGTTGEPPMCAECRKANPEAEAAVAEKAVRKWACGCQAAEARYVDVEQSKCPVCVAPDYREGGTANRYLLSDDSWLGVTHPARRVTFRRNSDGSITCVAVDDVEPGDPVVISAPASETIGWRCGVGEWETIRAHIAVCSGCLECSPSDDSSWQRLTPAWLPDSPEKPTFPPSSVGRGYCHQDGGRAWVLVDDRTGQWLRSPMHDRVAVTKSHTRQPL